MCGSTRVNNRHRCGRSAGEHRSTGCATACSSARAMRDARFCASCGSSASTAPCSVRTIDASSRSSSDGARLIAGSSPCSVWYWRQMARPRAAADRLGHRVGILGDRRGIGHRLEDRREVPDRHALAQQLPQHALDVADATPASARAPRSASASVCADAVDHLLGLLARQQIGQERADRSPTGASTAPSSDRRPCSRPRWRDRAARRDPDAPAGRTPARASACRRSARVAGARVDRQQPVGDQLAARDLDALDENRVGRAARAAGCRRRAPAARPCRSRWRSAGEWRARASAACRPASRRPARPARSRLRR